MPGRRFEGLSDGREVDVERVELQYGVTLLRERKVEALEPVAEFLASLSEEHRKKVQYGVMLLKKLSDFKVSFVEACKDTIYLMTTALGWIMMRFWTQSLDP